MRNEPLLAVRSFAEHLGPAPLHCDDLSRQPLEQAMTSPAEYAKNTAQKRYPTIHRLEVDLSSVVDLSRRCYAEGILHVFELLQHPDVIEAAAKQIHANHFWRDRRGSEPGIVLSKRCICGDDAAEGMVAHKAKATLAAAVNSITEGDKK